MFYPCGPMGTEGPREPLIVIELDPNYFLVIPNEIHWGEERNICKFKNKDRINVYNFWVRYSTYWKTSSESR